MDLSLPRCFTFVMPSPPKKKRKKRSERGEKQSNGSAPPEPQQKKSSKKKKGSYRHWTKDEKKFRDGLIKNAAEQIIEARANNPKNKPGEKPLVPHGLYVRKANEIQKHCAGLAITADDIRNRVRAIDKKQMQEKCCRNSNVLCLKKYECCSHKSSAAGCCVFYNRIFRFNQSLYK
jgi:hypothetical protein